MNHGRIGIALCGAELAGSVHIGILFALEDIGVKPDVIAGTSAGSLIASMYAHGYTIHEFRKAVGKFPGLFLLDYGFPFMSSVVNQIRHRWQGSNIPVPKGIFRGRKLYRYIKQIHRNRMLKMPLYVVATDLYTTNAVAFTNEESAVKQGYAHRTTDLYSEIMGSCSIPSLFTPVRYRQWMLVDGGVRDQIPVTILRQAGCDKIFAIDVLKLPQDWYPITMIDVLQRSLETLKDEAIDNSDLKGDSIYRISPKLERTSWWSSQAPMAKNIDVGYKYILDHKQDILKFVGSL